MSPSIAEMEKMCGLTADDVMNIAKNNQTPLEKEANEVWQHLDNLAATDPVEYKKYIAQQMEDGKKYLAENKGEKEKPKPNIPKSVFWVETEVLDFNEKPTGIPRYFNVCESDSIEYTDDKNLNIFMSELDNRQIDCVIHPNFMAKCKDDNLFMHDTVQLLFETYTAEHKEKENVKKQYKHHKEGRKLVMKVPKLPGEKKSEEDSVMDILGKVRHSKDAQKMMEDDKTAVAQRLFDMYSEKDTDKGKPKEVAAPDPETTFTKPEIVELKPSLSHTVANSADGSESTIRIPLPQDTLPSSVGVELEDDITLLVTTPDTEPLTLPLLRKASTYSAKFIKTKHLLKITIVY
eukprot:TRINITY_DN6863_c0_g1_i1.p2 TRINITY_DN6863_c0_g1~~TRINITY_DN6863_c0_g1_i1.p2  ORF type:complete len:348 (+),score=113.70 TRINITY_DN6863_c0_g1_i1:1179-2222(+)